MERATADRIIRAAFARALEAVDPAPAVERAVSSMPDLLAGPPPIVLAIGKAAGGMTAGLVTALPHGIARGIVITKSRSTVGELPASVGVFEAGHPIPDERTIAATETALAMLAASSPDIPVVVLISGGGSALFEAPVDGATLDEIAQLTGRMLRAGATIHELNAVRGRLSRVKRGGLLDYIRSPSPRTLVLSDVIGNDLGVIASGPTAAIAEEESPRPILERLGLWDEVTGSMKHLFAEADARPSRSDASVHIVADNNTAVDAFRTSVDRPVTVPARWRQRTGEAREIAAAWVAECRTVPDEVGVLVGGGEATVTVRGHGVGGRNTEFAVAAALELDRLEMDDWVVASLATDGDDGPTGAAGGIVSRESVRVARAAGVDPAHALAENDTKRVLDAAGGLVVTGPTGTNVNDLYVAVRVR